MELKDKTFIVTGASRGIGAAAVRLLASKGANLVIGSRRKPELDRLVEQVTQSKGSAVCLPGDVSNEAYAEALVRCAQEYFGGIDGAFNKESTADLVHEIGRALQARWKPKSEIAEWMGFRADTS